MDRFIPQRSRMDFGYALSELTTERAGRSSSAAWDLYDRHYRRRSILGFATAVPSSSPPPSPSSLSADRVLAAPGLANGFHRNLLDWGCEDRLAIGLGREVHHQRVGGSKNAAEGFDAGDENDEVASLRWAPDGHQIAIGLDRSYPSGSSSSVQLWDVRHGHLLSTTLGGTHEQPSPVGAMAWNCHNVLATGSSDGAIVINDPRSKDCCHSVYGPLRGRGREICGLAWSIHNANHLASGRSDGLVHVWDTRIQRRLHPWIHRFTEHTAGACGVRALAWCPSENGLLATGGGGRGGGGCIRFWDTRIGACLNSLDMTAGPVLALLWSRSKPLHILSSCTGRGNLTDLLTLWRYPSMTRATNLVGHTDIALYLAQGPNGCSVASGAGGTDETVRLWNHVFSPMPKEPPAMPPFADSYHTSIRSAFWNKRLVMLPCLKDSFELPRCQTSANGDIEMGTQSSWGF